MEFQLPWVLCVFFKYLQQLKYYYVESFYLKNLIYQRVCSFEQRDHVFFSFIISPELS